MNQTKFLHQNLRENEKKKIIVDNDLEKERMEVVNNNEEEEDDDEWWYGIDNSSKNYEQCLIMKSFTMNSFIYAFITI